MFQAMPVAEFVFMSVVMLMFMLSGYDSSCVYAFMSVVILMSICLHVRGNIDVYISGYASSCVYVFMSVVILMSMFQAMPVVVFMSSCQW